MQHETIIRMLFASYPSTPVSEETAAVYLQLLSKHAPEYLEWAVLWLVENEVAKGLPSIGRINQVVKERKAACLFYANSSTTRALLADPKPVRMDAHSDTPEERRQQLARWGEARRMRNAESRRNNRT